MRDKLLKAVEKLYIWLLPKNISAVNTQVIPITRSIVFRSGMNKEQIKERLVKDMTDRLMQYVEFTEELKEDTKVTMLTARIDVIQKTKVEGVKVDEE